MVTDQVELGITIAVLLVEIALFGLCYYRIKQPPDPANPRLINYPVSMLFLTLIILATLAHIISLVSGQQLQPRRKRGL